MVRRVKRGTFEHKEHEVEMDYLEVERTICVLSKAYGLNKTLKLKEMVGFKRKEAYSILDEGGVIKVLEIFAPRSEVINFMRLYNRSCSWELFDRVCDDCMCTLGSNECYEERNFYGGMFNEDRKQQLDGKY
jgi:hypothetical protein